MEVVIVCIWIAHTDVYSYIYVAYIHKGFVSPLWMYSELYTPIVDMCDHAFTVCLLPHWTQVDALMDSLTGRQHLVLFCRLRGLPPEEV